MPDVGFDDVQRNFGAYREMAKGGAVRVMHDDKPSVVIVSAAEYDRLERRDKQVMLNEDLPEWLIERIDKAPCALVSTTEARRRLNALLEDVARGGEVMITRRGAPVARLVPVAPSFDREKARRAAAGLREASRGATLGGIAIKDLVNESRC